jgi:hypothetical protein
MTKSIKRILPRNLIIGSRSIKSLRFEVLTATSVKMAVFWNAAP